MSSDSPSAPEKPVSARDRILNTAGPLFYREGYRAIGIDRVIAEADVAKATFYKHFPSKDDLIVAWIARAEERSSQSLPPLDGPEPLTAYVDRMIAIARQGGCMGCTYQGTAAEFSDPAHPAHAAAMGVKTRVLDALETRARIQGVSNPQATAHAVFLFLEGIWASVRMFGSSAPLSGAETAARRLFQ
jgi:AcrR family transcriptional regulator